MLCREFKNIKGSRDGWKWYNKLSIIIKIGIWKKLIKLDIWVRR